MPGQPDRFDLQRDVAGREPPSIDIPQGEGWCAPWWQAAVALLRRDLLLFRRHPQDLLNPQLFFLLIAALFPLGVTPKPEILREIAPGTIWIAALLSAIFSLDTLFREDFRDGTLEQLCLSPYPLPLLVSVRILAHWLGSGLPLILTSPLLALLFGLPEREIFALLATLLLGTPLISAIGAIGSALTLGLRRSGVLLTLIVMPLYVPVLIFGAGAVSAAAHGLPIAAQLYFLAAMLVLALTLAPFAIAAAIRIALG